MAGFDTGDGAFDAAATELMGGLLVPPGGGQPDPNLEHEISAFYDFSAYRFFLEPLRLRFEPGDADDAVDDLDGTEIPLGVYIEFDDFSAGFRTWVQARVEQFVWADTVQVNEQISGYGTVWEPTRSRRRRITALSLSGVSAFRIGMAPRLFAAYKRSTDQELYLGVARDRVAAMVSSWLVTLRDATGNVQFSALRAIEDVGFWSQRTALVLAVIDEGFAGGDPRDDHDDANQREELPPSYPFEPFAIGSVNFGLQLIYRQDWIALGTRAGEIVRTLPLGPKQTETVTVKAIRKAKAARTAEVTTSVETSTESSMATKDSQDVVQEASESSNWHAESTAEASFGFGSGSVAAGMGGDSDSSSRDAKSTLNETMEKTASKLRTDTKIVVSTENEETSDFTRVSEISNPNDQIAVTYIYSRLQRQYELRTYLSDVNLVIFIAERVPAPSEVDDAWVRRYDWILSRALLDESFRADLDAVRGGQPTGAGVSGDIDPAIAGVMDSLKTGIPDYAGVSGKVPDFFENPQQAYERELERSRARAAADSQYFRSLNRVRLHIFDNVLHYMRAIWSSEDPDQRLMRYGKIRVATNWEFVPTGTLTLDGLPGYYAPAIHNYARDTSPLSEMIHPVGPIGYSGNYAVFYLQESTRWRTLLSALGHLQAPYFRLIVEIDAPVAVGVTAEAAETRLGPGTYRLSTEGAAPGQITISHHTGSGAFEVIGARPLTSELRFHGVVVRIADPSALADRDEITLRIQMIPQLDDPELKAVRASTARLPLSLEAAFFDEVTVKSMSSMFIGVRRAIAGSFIWADLSADQQSSLRDRYYDYLLRDRHSRRILVDTNNLILTREVDTTPTLEPFKALHRAADVLSSFEELAAGRLENERLQRRLDADRLGDPDIDKLTVVAGTGQIADLAALDTLSDDPPVPPDDGG